MNSDKITITHPDHGKLEVVLASGYPRKAARSYKKKLLHDAEMGEGGKPVIKLSSSDEANEELVRCMIKAMTNDKGESVQVTDEFLDEMDEGEYQKILEVLMERMPSQRGEEKKN